MSSNWIEESRRAEADCT